MKNKATLISVWKILEKFIFEVLSSFVSAACAICKLHLNILKSHFKGLEASRVRCPASGRESPMTLIALATQLVCLAHVANVPRRQQPLYLLLLWCGVSVRGYYGVGLDWALCHRVKPHSFFNIAECRPSIQLGVTRTTALMRFRLISLCFLVYFINVTVTAPMCVREPYRRGRRTMFGCLGKN